MADTDSAYRRLFGALEAADAARARMFVTDDEDDAVAAWYEMTAALTVVVRTWTVLRSQAAGE